MVNHQVCLPTYMFLIARQLFLLTHLVFLELDTHQPHLHFKILDERNNGVIPMVFYLQLLNQDEQIRQ